jgi:RecA-family ATPase
MGADMNRVIILEGVKERDYQGNIKERPFNIRVDVARLMEESERWKALRFIVIDPISAYLGDVETHVNAEVRATLAPLARLAAERGCAVIGISHLNKGNGPAVYRTSGSIAFVAAARSVWACGRDKSDETGRGKLFLSVKNNLGPDMGGLKYEILSGEVPLI